jgi:hypothetical protein
VSHPRELDEIYNEFDLRELPCAHSDIFLFSYGEYVPDHRGMHFDPFIERAEKLAKAHHDRLRGPRFRPVANRTARMDVGDQSGRRPRLPST